MGSGRTLIGLSCVDGFAVGMVESRAVEPQCIHQNPISVPALGMLQAEGAEEMAGGEKVPAETQAVVLVRLDERSHLVTA